MTFLIQALVGLAVGVHIATWGMYKDSIHEGFARTKYVRSILVGTTLAPVGAAVAGVDVLHPSGVVLLFGLTYALERAVTEFWKTFIRDEDQSKYFIPMQFHIMGRVVRNPVARAGLGAGMVVAALALLLFARSLEPGPGEAPYLARVVLVASVGGWFSAFGGAFKDAPIEGFETLKFFRSPAVAVLYGVAVSGFTDSYPLVALTAVGFTVATLETYKAFVFPTTPRGKFAGKPILFPEMLVRRRAFVPVYVMIWMGVVATFVAAFVTCYVGASS
jgi:hypothetical protein